MALAQCPRSGGSIPSGGSFLRATRRRAQVPPAAVYISRDDSALSGAVLFPCPLTEAARAHDAHGDALASPRRGRPILRTVAPLF